MLTLQELEAVKKYRREYYQAHREKRISQVLANYNKNPSVGIERARQWRLDNPERFKFLKERWQKNKKEEIKKYNAEYYINKTVERRKQKKNENRN